MNCHVRILLYSLISLLLITGCDLNFPGDGIICTREFVYGLTVNLTDENGDPISDATVVITGGVLPETLTEFQDGNYSGAGERRGTYTLTVTAIGFEPVTIEDIVITGDVCHVTPVSRDITLVATQ